VGAGEQDPPVLDSDGVVECPSSRSLLAQAAMLGRKPGCMQRAACNRSRETPNGLVDRDGPERIASATVPTAS
jgi:hypothetical protein